MSRDFMQRALELAAANVGKTGDNPSVGCVIVKDGAVVGEGATADGGRPHAEEVALAAADDAARGATVYVTLEPCAKRSSGATSCADLLIAAGVARVVIATGDPHPNAAGVGVERLRAAGVVVESGVMEADARALNLSFLSRFNDLPVHSANSASRAQVAHELAPIVTQLDALDCFEPGWRAESEGLSRVSTEPGLSIFRDAKDRRWVVFDEGESVTRVEVDVSAAPISKNWSPYEEQENLNAWVECFYDAQVQINGLLGGSPSYLGYFEDAGFPENEQALYLALWQHSSSRLMLQLGPEYDASPDKRFRLYLVTSRGEFSRKSSDLWRSRKVVPR